MRLTDQEPLVEKHSIAGLTRPSASPWARQAGVVAATCLALAALAGCSKKPAETASHPPDQPAPPVALPRDWNDDAAKAAIAADSGAKATYVCRFAFFDNPQLFTNAHPVDRPQVGMKKISDTQESVAATSAQKAQEIMEAAINKSAPVGPCTADLSATPIDKSIPLASYTDLQSGSQIAVLYYFYAKEPMPAADLARSFDMDYQRTSDTFKREDLLKTLIPKYEAQQKAEAASPYFKVRLSASLGHYNPQAKSFPLLDLALDGNSRLSMNDSSDYAIVPRGDERFAAITPAGEDQARALEAKVSASGRDRMNVNVDLYVKAADAVSFAARKDIVAKVVAAHITDETGGPIADIQ
jgi:hypothetical protein